MRLSSFIRRDMGVVSCRRRVSRRRRRHAAVLFFAAAMGTTHAPLQAAGPRRAPGVPCCAWSSTPRGPRTWPSAPRTAAPSCTTSASASASARREDRGHVLHQSMGVLVECAVVWMVTSALPGAGLPWRRRPAGADLGGEGICPTDFGYAVSSIQSNLVSLDHVGMDIRIQTSTIHLNPKWVKSVYTMDDSNPLPGISMTN